MIKSFFKTIGILLMIAMNLLFMGMYWAQDSLLMMEIYKGIAYLANALIGLIL